MPELPEVEVICRSLLPHLTGREIVWIGFSQRRLRLPVPRGALRLLIQGSRVQGVERRGKYLLLHMSSGALLSLHLGMSGRLGLFTAGSPRAKHDHLRFRLDDGMELRFNDPRRFGSVQVLDGHQGAGEELLSMLGPEPFASDFSASYLLERARGRTQPIKNFLMDARVVAGIGNIYASEILFAAGVDPTRPVGSLGEGTWEAVVKACRQVLAQAIECGGTTISDFADGMGQAGAFQCELRVYGREGEGCHNCGRSVARLVLAGRATYFCPGCQR